MKRCARNRLSMVHLEDRSVPASFSVVNTLDAGAGSLRDAIASLSLSADAANTIDISAIGQINLISALPPIAKNVFIDGPGATNLTITRDSTVSGFNLLAVNITEPGGMVTIEGVSIHGASAVTTGGGGIIIAAGDVTIMNCVVSNNLASFKGAGVANFGPGTLTITNTTIAGNTTDTDSQSSGGGISSAGPLVISNSKITGNSASVFGGGIYCYDASVSLTNTTVSGNVAGSRAGGLYVHGGDADISNSTISGNTSKSDLRGGGGVMFAGNGQFTATNTTVSGNSAFGTGGGISLRNGVTATIRNSTVTGNTASTNFGDPGDGGGGIAVYYYSTGTLNLFSTVISGNTHTTGGHHDDLSVSVNATVNAENCYISDSGDGFTLAASKNNVFDTFANLNLGPLQFNNNGTTQTHAIRTGSKAIDKGSNIAPALTTDQTGVTARAVDGGGGNVPDIGAFEFVPSPNPVATGAFANVTTLNGGFTGDYSFTVNYNAPNGDKINTASLGTGDVIVSGPSYSKTATFTGFSDPNGNQSLIVASYTIPANTLGTVNWDIADNGTYQVNSAANEVLSTAGKAVDAGLVNTFSVNVGNDYLVTTDADNGPGSLRNILALARTDTPGVLDRIQFDTAFFATQRTIALQDVLVIDSDVQILGPAAKVVLDQQIPDLEALDVSDGSSSPVIAQISNVIVENSGGTNANVGGIFVGVSDRLDLRNSTIANNTGSSAGGIFVDTIGTLSLRNSSVSGNVSLNSGGGILFYLNGALLIEDSAITKNTAGGSYGGGGLYFQGVASPGSFRVVNSTISGNKATNGDGGGVSVRSGPATNNFEFFNSTITANSAIHGGGIARTSGSGKFTLVSSIVAGNSATLNPDIAAETADSIIASFSAVGVDPGVAWQSANNAPAAKNLGFGTSLQLGALANNGGTTLTHSPGAASPLVNAGANPLNLSTDQIGAARAQGGGVDIGAFERAGGVAITISGFSVNGGAAQRSRLTTIQVNFASPVDVAQFQTAGAITLTRTGIPTNNIGTVGTVVNTGNGMIVSPANGLASSITITFGNLQNAGINAGSLADGRWQLAVPAAGYLSPNGPSDTQLRRLFGNVNNDTVVDASDFGAYPVFGASTGNPFDFNDDGSVQADDFGQFGNRFGVTLL